MAKRKRAHTGDAAQLARDLSGMPRRIQRISVANAVTNMGQTWIANGCDPDAVLDGLRQAVAAVEQEPQGKGRDHG